MDMIRLLKSVTNGQLDAFLQAVVVEVRGGPFRDAVLVQGAPKAHDEREVVPVDF